MSPCISFMHSSHIIWVGLKKIDKWQNGLSWCATGQQHSLLRAVTFTVTSNHPLRVCYGEKAKSASSNFFPRGPVDVIHACLSLMCYTHTFKDTHRHAIYQHEQPGATEIFINPPQASSPELHSLCFSHFFFKQINLKNQRDRQKRAFWRFG